MIGQCELCHKRFRTIKLPRGWDPDWLNGGPLSGCRVAWMCAECAVAQSQRREEIQNCIEIRKVYLMPLRHLAPALGIIAVLVMMCLAVAGLL